MLKKGKSILLSNIFCILIKNFYIKLHIASILPQECKLFL